MLAAYLLLEFLRSEFRTRESFTSRRTDAQRCDCVSLFLARIYLLMLGQRRYARFSTYPITRVPEREVTRLQDHYGSRSSGRPRTFAPIRGPRRKSPTIVSDGSLLQNDGGNCLVDILRCGHSILPAGLSDVSAIFYQVAPSTFDRTITRETIVRFRST